MSFSMSCRKIRYKKLVESLYVIVKLMACGTLPVKRNFWKRFLQPLQNGSLASCNKYLFGLPVKLLIEIYNRTTCSLVKNAAKRSRTEFLVLLDCTYERVRAGRRNDTGVYQITRANARISFCRSNFFVNKLSHSLAFDIASIVVNRRKVFRSTKGKEK